MEDYNGKDLNIATLMKCAFKPSHSNLFNRIKNLKTPVKNKILMTMLDGKWHGEYEIIRIVRQHHEYFGSVTLQSMIESLNQITSATYLRKKIVNGKIYYKISNNYLGLVRAAFTKLRFFDL